MREKTTEHGSTIYQVQIAIVVAVLSSDTEITEGVRDLLLRFLTTRKSSMRNIKAILRLDDHTGLDLSGMMETFEEEKAAK